VRGVDEGEAGVACLMEGLVVDVDDWGVAGGGPGALLGEVGLMLFAVRADDDGYLHKRLLFRYSGRDVASRAAWAS
jgi:hypothetical protein